MPLANLQDRHLSHLARSTNAQTTSTLIDIDLGTLRDIRVMAILRHNLSLDATVRVTAYSDAGRSQLVDGSDTGALQVWLPFYPSGSLPWGHPDLWEGKINIEDRDGYQFDFIRAYSASVVARYWRVEIVDTANPDGYVELGRCILAPAWEPSINISYGFSFGYDSDATVNRTVGGRRIIEENVKWRTATCAIDKLPDGEAAACVFDIQRRLSKVGEIIFIFDPDDDSQAMWQRSFLANLEDLDRITLAGYDANTVGFRFIEVEGQ